MLADARYAERCEKSYRDNESDLVAWPDDFTGLFSRYCHRRSACYYEDEIDILFD